MIDPVPMAQGFRKAGPQVSANCLKHEDKPRGITDELTFAIICTKSPDSSLDSAMTFPYFVDFKDVQDFEGKKIARTYETRVKDFQTISARMTLLEGLAGADNSLFAVQETTPKADQISTTFVSTLKEESLMRKHLRFNGLMCVKARRMDT